MGSLKKIVAFLLCAVLLMGVMAGCAQKEPAQETTSENETTQTEVKANETETTNETKEPVVEKKTIKFWNGFTGSDQETLTKNTQFVQLLQIWRLHLWFTLQERRSELDPVLHSCNRR